MKKAFTLIEIIMVVAVLGVIMMAVTGILFNSFKARNQSNNQQIVDDNGTYVISEIRRRVLPSDTLNQIGDNFSFEDGGSTVPVICESTGISIGGTTLTTEVSITCGDFATVNGKTVSLNFTLSIGNQEAGPQNYATKTFQTVMTLRN